MSAQPCPFCGGAAEKRTEYLDERFSYADRVCYVCTGCGVSQCATGDRSKPGYADNTGVEKKALAKWNRRTPGDQK